ncbi:protein RSI-1-like [Gastrolobium bilobum]|uniref:protein RSI-1-like n=1 Tax=Gastrolobium bilobum TaxID=150636 RepID=UPI002AB231F0|nr:protein RSI-1-like [Gastrolobium bilobum]
MAGRPYSILIILSLLLMVTFSDVTKVYGLAQLRPSDCNPKCIYRCSAKGHKKRCMFYCQRCCAKCLCVPPGLDGNNRQVCPCYNNWKTRSGGHKCP